MSELRALPPSVRARVVSHAAESLSALSADEIPGPLRRIARFTPRKRASVAGSAIVAALEDEQFRASVSVTVRLRRPEAASALADVEVAARADPVEVAALLWLLRPPEWEQRLPQVLDELVAQEQAAAAGMQVAEVARLEAELEAERAAHRAVTSGLAAQLAQARAERDQQTKTVRRATDRAQRAEAAASAALRRAEEQVAEGERRRSELEAELRRTKARLAEAESVVAAGRAATRREREGDTVRLRVLLDALIGAAQGLRRELALPPVEERPGDLVSSGRGPDPGGPSAQGRGSDDPAYLERLLSVPAVHLIVDGYNVTKTGWGTLSLEQQRDRLVSGVAALVARTAVEVTVVFDGAERDTAASSPVPRGVRVRFSDPGEIADVLIARFVSAEPPGRPLVVVSSDGEVAAHARAAGAHAVPSIALVRLLDRS